MKRKRLLSIVLLFFVLISSFVMQLVDFFVFRQEIQFVESYYESVVMSMEGFYCPKAITLSEIYVMLLSVAMYVFENASAAIIALNIVSQLLIVLLIYFIINRGSNTYMASMIAMVVSIFLLFADKMYEVSEFHVCMLSVLFLINIIWILAQKLYVKKSKDTLEVQKAGDDYSYGEVNSVITLDDILGKEIRNAETETLIVNENVQEAPNGMVEIQMEDAEKNKTQYIENPLPVPKRKEHKQMDYAIDTLNENDDFDIMDMTGMEFYDIE